MVITTLRLPDTLGEEVERAARSAGIPITTWINQVLRSATAAPITRQRYTLKARIRHGQNAVITRRFHKIINAYNVQVRMCGLNPTQEEAVLLAYAMVKRNHEGDYGQAVSLLQNAGFSVQTLP